MSIRIWMWIGIKMEIRIRIRIGIKTMRIHKTGVNPAEDDSQEEKFNRRMNIVSIYLS
jgi:hypothetical protein